MTWTVKIKNKAVKQVQQLGEDIELVLQLLIDDLKRDPAPGKHWPNYGRLHGTKKNVDQRHCHLIKSNPTYVCCWEVKRTQRLIEVYYVGTHEKAPY